MQLVFVLVLGVLTLVRHVFSMPVYVPVAILEYRDAGPSLLAKIHVGGTYKVASAAGGAPFYTSAIKSWAGHVPGWGRRGYIDFLDRTDAVFAAGAPKWNPVLNTLPWDRR